VIYLSTFIIFKTLSYKDPTYLLARGRRTLKGDVWVGKGGPNRPQLYNRIYKNLNSDSNHPLDSFVRITVSTVASHATDLGSTCDHFDLGKFPDRVHPFLPRSYVERKRKEHPFFCPGGRRRMEDQLALQHSSTLALSHSSLFLTLIWLAL
jgi:hypothetical protein